MVTEICLISIFVYYLERKINKTLFSLFLLFFLNFIYLYFHFIGKSTFISLVLVVFSTLSVFIFLKNSNFFLTKQKFKIYITFNILFLLIVYFFTINPTANDPKWFFNNSDNFSDSVKLIVAFDYFFDEDLSDIDNLNLKFFIVNPYYDTKVTPPIDLPNTKYLNEYSLNAESEDWILKCSYIKELENDCISVNSDNIYNYFSLPPLHLLFKTFLAYLLSLFKNVTIFLLFNISILIFGLFKLYKYFFPNKLFLIFILHLISFPFLFSIQRGNFISTVIYIACALLFFRYYFLDKINFFDVLLFGLIINLRPTYIVFIIIFLDFKNIKFSLIKIFQIISISGLIFYLSLNIVNQYHNLYNLETFLKMLNYFSEFNIYYQYYSFELTTIKPQTFNNGLYPLMLNLKYSVLFLISKLGFVNIEKMFSANNLYFFSNFIVFIVLAIFLLKNLKYSHSKKNKILITTCSALLIGPFNGDYHLILLLIPFALFLLENNKAFQLSIILFIFLIKPHSAVFPIYGVSISTVVNSFAIFYLMVSNLFFRKETFKNS